MKLPSYPRMAMTVGIGGILTLYFSWFCKEHFINPDFLAGILAIPDSEIAAFVLSNLELNILFISFLALFLVPFLHGFWRAGIKLIAFFVLCFLTWFALMQSVAVQEATTQFVVTLFFTCVLAAWIVIDVLCCMFAKIKLMHGKPR